MSDERSGEEKKGKNVRRAKKRSGRDVITRGELNRRDKQREEDNKRTGAKSIGDEIRHRPDVM